MALITASDLRMFQDLAEGEMVDSCVITGPATAPAFNETTGTYTSTPGPVLYSGRCKRQTPPGVRAELQVESGDHKSTESRAQLHIPINAKAPNGAVAVIGSGAIVTMTACPNDPGSVGRKFYVDGPAGKTWPTAQRLNVTEVVG